MSPQTPSITNLVPSIRTACANALREYNADRTGTCPAFLICIVNGSAMLLYVNETENGVAPPSGAEVWDVVLGAGDLLPALAAVSSLSIPEEELLYKFTKSIAGNLISYLYQTKNYHPELLALSALLEQCMLHGIESYAKYQQKREQLKSGGRPELN